MKEEGERTRSKRRRKMPDEKEGRRTRKLQEDKEVELEENKFEDKEEESFFSSCCSLLLPLLYRQMRRNFSPPQLPVSFPPISALPQHFVFRPLPLLPLTHLIFLVLQHLLTLLLGSSFIHPRHFPSFPLSTPLLTLLFPLSPSFLSISSSSCSPFCSTFVFSSLSSPSLLFLCHPALSIYLLSFFFRGPLPSLSLSWSSSSTFSSFAYFSPSPHSLPPPLVPSSPLTPTVPQLQQAKSAERNLKRYVL